ncbi:hypothetical protein L1987_64267 [Smallanthus sonchifolius]|uniref:Uncharacterized protein n=1 Tax=Smallanthus sonchifolius TaxID=185202 RepID=A0ACB9CFG1_9ASTR|nr:hypothetical protein L1987_64267 [Smallanthus sonchifolius]
MFSCCGGGKEDSIDDTPSSKAKTAPPRGPPNVGGGTIGDPRSNGAVRTGAPVKALPIEAPKLPLADLIKMTGNFGSRALLGDGSYCQVYYAKLSDEQEAIIKKLDTGSSPEPDFDFTNQLSVVSRLKKEYIVETRQRFMYTKLLLVISIYIRLAAVAALCIQYEADFRPNMTIVVKALRPLVNVKPARTESQA